MKIREVARRSGLPVKTIRFHSQEVFAELALIHTLKAMEIRLPNVRQILEARRSGVCTCATPQVRTCTKAGEIEQMITALRDLHSELEDLLSPWQDCGGRKGSTA